MSCYANLEEGPTPKRPFHETVIEAIKQASTQDLILLAGLLQTTIIPKNHDEIIAAWDRRVKGMCAGDMGVTIELLRQKQVAAEQQVSGSS